MTLLRLLTAIALLAPVAGALVVPSVALAQDPTTAEKLRLQEEMKKLAQKNAWTGVERSYQALVDLKVELSFEDHFLGAQAARYLGKTWEMYDRLSKARAIDPQQDIITEMEGIDAAYGRVDIQGHPRKRPELTVAVMPFAPDERKSIEYAMEVVINTGSFRGMLPAGEYTVGDQTFTVAAGQDFAVIEVSKKAGGQTEAASTGLITYAGPVVTAGYSFLSTGDVPEGKVDAGVALPAGMGGSGFGAQVGAEVGLGLNWGVAATFGYNGMYGTDTLHGFNGWLAAAIRPGDLRVAVGPTYGMINGSGTGVNEWWTRAGVDPRTNPNDQILFEGRSMVGGLQIGAGYGLLDIGSMQGIVEIGGGWQNDGTRSWTNAGLRIGIVPKIERYEG